MENSPCRADCIEGGKKAAGALGHERRCMHAVQMALAVLGGSRPKGRTSQECHGRTEKRSAVHAHESLSVRVSRRFKGFFIEQWLQVGTVRGGCNTVSPQGSWGCRGYPVMTAERELRCHRISYPRERFATYDYHRLPAD